MRFLLGLRNGLQTLVAAAFLVSMAACASEPRLVDHSFEFDARWDSPDAEILDYRYGNSKQPGARPPEYMLRSGKIAQQVGISGEMLRGDALYVKWRIKSTGEVYEDSVNLRSRLPTDMNKQRIRFIVSGPQLYVFVISPERLDPNPCPSREALRKLGESNSPFDKVFSMYCYRKITTIYPDQPVSH